MTVSTTATASTVSAISLNTELFKESYELVAKLGKKLEWNQRIGKFNFRKEGNGCCIGAWIAFYFNVCEADENGVLTYEDGIDYMLEEVGIDQEGLECLLIVCGAPEEPFGSDPWEIRPELVWERIQTIEKVLDYQRLLEAVDNGMNITDNRGVFEDILEFN